MFAQHLLSLVVGFPDWDASRFTVETQFGFVDGDVDPSVHSVTRAGDVAATLEAFFEDAPDPFFTSAGLFEAHRVENEETGLLDFAGDEYDVSDRAYEELYSLEEDPDE